MTDGIQLPPEAAQAVRMQVKEFEKKFGRPMRPGDPLFWDPHSDIPVPMPEQHMEDGMLVAMADAGIRPALMWIWIKTGLIPTEENLHLMQRRDRRDVNRAGREFEKNKPDPQPYIDAARERLARKAYPQKRSGEV